MRWSRSTRTVRRLPASGTPAADVCPSVALATQVEGQEARAVRWFERTCSACGPAGLFAEECDVTQRPSCAGTSRRRSCTPNCWSARPASRPRPEPRSRGGELAGAVLGVLARRQQQLLVTVPQTGRAADRRRPGERDGPAGDGRRRRRSLPSTSRAFRNSSLDGLPPFPCAPARPDLHRSVHRAPAASARPGGA